MSSRAFRSVIRRREHYERHQPEARARFGLLEKHKDYVVRAKNFHKREKRLGALRARAANKNPDEFSFGMLSSKTKGGVHEKKKAVDAAKPKLTPELLAVMQTQDVRYVATMRAAEEAKIEKLASSLHMTTGGDTAAAAAKPSSGRGGPRGTHTVFVETAEEAADFDAAGFFDTEPGSLGQAYNRPRRGAVEPALPAKTAAAKKAKSGAAGTAAPAYAELTQRRQRSVQLASLEAHMQLSRALLAPGKRVKVADAVGAQPAQYKWRSERKR